MSRSLVRFTRSLFVVCALNLSVTMACSEPPKIVVETPSVTAVPATARSQPRATESVPTHSPVPTEHKTIPATAGSQPRATDPIPTLSPAPTEHKTVQSFGGNIGELGPDWVGERVSFTGRIVEVGSFSRGFKFTLEDSTGRIVLLVWDETYDGIAERDGLHNGALVQVNGAIETFEGELQIVPSSASDVIVLQVAKDRAPERNTGSISSTDVGSWITIEGHIVSVKPFSSGLRVHVDDGTGEVLVLLWQNVLERVPGSTESLAAGGRVRVSGCVAEYQSTLEVVPAVPFDVESLTTAAMASPVPTTLTPISEIDEKELGKKATIAGQVTETASFSGGFKFALDDGTDQITFIMWHNIYDTHPDAVRLNVGAEARVTGWITEYKGVIQIEPQTADAVTLISQPASIPPVRSIEELANYMGQRITIVGTVVSADETRSGARLFVSDENGTALVFIWPNILERIPNIQLLGKPGTPVRIVGIVQMYQGDLELLPALPYDVEITPP